MAGHGKPSQETQLASHRGHPLPRRSSPENSITLRNHGLARDASVKAIPGSNPASASFKSPNRRFSSGESHETGGSDPNKWFDRSNRNVSAAYNANSMDIDPPFYQKETDSSNEETNLDNLRFLQGGRSNPLIRPTATHSSSADDYRSVIDDLTIENKRLKEELKRYKQFGPDLMRRDKLFEIKVHGLPKRKKRELEATLRDFAASLEGSSEAPSPRKKSRHTKNMFDSAVTMSKHASSSSSNSRPVDSAYASGSTGPSSSVPNKSSGDHSDRPTMSSRARSSEQKVVSYLQDTPDGLIPQGHPMLLSDKEKKKVIVKRLEQLFTGRIRGRNLHRNQSLPEMDATLPSEDSSSIPPPPNPEASREARIQPQDLSQKKPRSRDNMSLSNSNGDRTESGGNGAAEGSGSGSGSGRTNPSPPNLVPPEQRPTRARDLDPDRVQIPSENMNYIRHLGLVQPEFLPAKRVHYQDVSPDADGWVYLNVLSNLAQLHMMNVTPQFIQKAVLDKSTKFQISPDGRKIRWRGGSDGTKFSSDSSGENSQKSPVTDETDGSNGSGQRKKRKVSDEGSKSGKSSKDSKSKSKKSGSNDSFHYKPLFLNRQGSSVETSTDETGSQASPPAPDDSNLGNMSRWALSGTGSSPRKKRRQDGAIVYYSGAPFCLDLSGDPGDVSSSTYFLTSASHNTELPEVAEPALRRSKSGSSLPIRPLSDEKAIVSEALDMDLDNVPELVRDEESPDEEEFEFPWSENPQEVHMRPIEPPLAACGLGGVLPEDHFAVVVTTRHPLLKELGAVPRMRREISEETTDVIAGRMASMTTSSPAPRGLQYMDSNVELEYISGRIRRFRPTALPPPATFFPPFSTDSDFDSDIDLLGSEDEGEAENDPSIEGLVSQRVNPDNAKSNEGELSSNDEEDEVDADNAGYERSEESEAEKPRRPSYARRQTTGSTGLTGKRPDLLHAGSSVATAGGNESGYNTSAEEDY